MKSQSKINIACWGRGCSCALKPSCLSFTSPEAPACGIILYTYIARYYTTWKLYEVMNWRSRTRLTEYFRFLRLFLAVCVPVRPSVGQEHCWPSRVSLSISQSVFRFWQLGKQSVSLRLQLIANRSQLVDLAGEVGILWFQVVKCVWNVVKNNLNKTEAQILVVAAVVDDILCIIAVLDCLSPSPWYTIAYIYIRICAKTLSYSKVDYFLSSGSRLCHVVRSRRLSIAPIRCWAFGFRFERCGVR